MLFPRLTAAAACAALLIRPLVREDCARFYRAEIGALSNDEIDRL